jgi:hypothetical protein
MCSVEKKNSKALGTFEGFIFARTRRLALETMSLFTRTMAAGCFMLVQNIELKAGIPGVETYIHSASQIYCYLVRA